MKNPLADMTHNHYYSFNLEGIHFVFLSFDYYESSAPETQHSMFLWIDNDLRKANDEKHRNLWSWIVVLTDKPIYSTTQDNYSQRQHWDELFKLYNVNIVLSGNQGYYERYFSFIFYPKRHQ